MAKPTERIVAVHQERVRGKTPGKACWQSPAKDCLAKAPERMVVKLLERILAKAPERLAAEAYGQDAGIFIGKDDGTNPGKAVVKALEQDGGESPGKSCGFIPGNDGGKTPATGWWHDPWKGCVHRQRASHIEGAKGGKKGIGKTKSPEASEPGSGKGMGTQH